MAKYDTVYTHTYTVPTYAIDKYNNSFLSFYIQLLQETAGFHSIPYKLNVIDLLKENRTWMMTKQRIDVKKLLTWPDTIQVETWVTEPTRFVTPRHFRAFTDTGEEVFSATSSWCLIDLEKHRPLPLSVIEDFSWVADEDRQVGNLKKMKRPEETPHEVFSYEPKVLYIDTDLNNHVNNSVYSSWALDSLPAAFRDAHTPCSIEIHYLKETYADDRICVRSEYDRDRMECFHTITASSADREAVVCHAKSSWKLRD